METTEKKLSELTFQLIVESTPNAIVLVNQEGKIAYINSQCERLFGYHRNELIGQDVGTLIPARFRDKHPQFFRMFFQMPAARAMGAGRELFARRKDDSEFPIEIGLNPLVLVDGTWVLASIIDITERKRAEEQFRLVVNSAPNAMVLVNQEGNISLVNDQAQYLFGYEAREMVGQKLEILIPKRFHPKHVDFRTMFFAMPQTRAMGAGRELFGVRKDGCEFPVEIGLNPIKTENGLSILASIIDITERKQQQEMRASREAAEAADKAKSSFLATMSHEIRTPMNGIIGMANLLMSSPLNSDQVEMCRTLQQSSAGLLALINDILDLSKIEAGKLQITPAVFELPLLVKNTVLLLTSEAVKKDLSLTWEVAPELSSSLYGDDGRIRQVLTNLLANAIKFTERGSVSVNASLLSRNDRQTSFRITVRDTGIGIPAAAQPGLFQPFTQADELIAKKFGGTGLGLSICRQLLKLMGGEIGFASELGRGSEFWFTLTLQNLPPPGAKFHSRTPFVPLPANTPTRLLHVLVVDDNAVNQAVARGLLTRLGHKVELAGNGIQALELLAAKSYDAVLMDCLMPELDGYDTTRRIRSRHIKGINPNIPVIALTASVMAEDRMRCIEAGMNGFISKPIDAKQLRVLLENIAPPPSDAADLTRASDGSYGLFD